MTQTLFHRTKEYLLDHLADVMLILCVTFCWLFFHSVNTSVQYPVQIVTKVVTVPASRTEAATHDKILLDIIAEQSSTSYNILSAYDNAKNQVRLFYSVIIAALVTVMFTGGIKTRGPVAAVALFVIASMYMIEVSFADLSHREVAKDTTLGVAQKKLIDLTPSDSTWYTLYYSARDSLANEASAPCVMHRRKIALAFQPNFEQVVYYVIPFLIVFFVRGFNIVPSRLCRRLAILKRKESNR